MSQAENKTCQNCKQNFTVEPEDFEFYTKIKVPPPTFCPECRAQRRISFYINGVSGFYKRKCDAIGKDIISIFPPHAPYPVYERNYWYSDNWDSLSYGRNYDFSRPFFIQFRQLQEQVPRYHTHNHNSINCEYCGIITNSKNCYLSTGIDNEDCYYSSASLKSKRCVDSWFISQCDSCFECVSSENCFKVFYSQHATTCMESTFLYNCSNCSYCFGCVNLKNKQYYIFNKPYSREDYFKTLKKYDLGGFFQYSGIAKEFNDFKLEFPRRFSKVYNSVDVSGGHIRDAKNCKNCFNVFGVENCKYTAFGGNKLSDSYDVFDAGSNSSLLYEAAGAGLNLYKSYFLIWTLEGNEVYYSDLCRNSSYLFACVGLRNKQYCILNKQYTKEEYEQLVPKIIEHMNNMPYIDKKGRIYKYGEFFPPELSPFSYNETIAQEYFPLTKEQATEQGYGWKEPEERNIQITLKTEDIPDHIKEVPEDILNQIIGCAHKGACSEQCTEAFKIIKPELEFYKKMNLPLPRLCPNCRHYQRIKQRNPLKLWKRQCQCAGDNSQSTTNNPQQPDYKYQNTAKHNHGDQPCLNQFETTYAPERPEIVYCEICYQQEVV
jgi:hypothetical protein